MKTKLKLITLATVIATLSGCAGEPVPLSKITNDKTAYLNQYFSKQSISESVFKKIPLEANTKGFSNTKVIFESKVIAGENIKNRKDIITYTGLGDGLIQTITEYQSNDITTGFNFAITYKGLHDIKWSYASTALNYSSRPYELKEISHWDKLGTNVGDVSRVDFKWGTVTQIMNFNDGQYNCTVTKQIKANEIHSSLSGQAKLLDCQTSKNGAVFLKSKYAYLEDLTFAIPVEINSANFKTEYKVLEITSP